MPTRQGPAACLQPLHGAPAECQHGRGIVGGGKTGAMRNTPASAERIGRYRRGRLSEWLAAAALLAKGYRILGRRVRTPYGEIDLIAVRGRRLAFIEVKRRATRAEAEAAVTPRQAGRIARAAEFWVSRHPAFRDHEQGLDVVFVLPNRLPVHLPNSLHAGR
jgi:putative endonuclease